MRKLEGKKRRKHEELPPSPSATKKLATKEKSISQLTREVLGSAGYDPDEVTDLTKEVGTLRCRSATLFKKSEKKAKEKAKDFKEYQSEELSRTAADDLMEKIRKIEAKKDFSKDLQAMAKIFRNMEKSDQARKDFFSLRAKAIDLLMEEVAQHKANTQILESMGQNISAEEKQNLPKETHLSC